MKILALDLATNTGVAVGVAGDCPKCWSVNLGGQPNGKRGSNLLRLIQGLIVEHEPDLVVVEAAIGGKNASAFLIGLVACVEAVCWNRNVQCERFHNGTIRRHFLGKAYTARDFPHLKPAAAKKAIKQLVVDRCRLLGWMVEDHDSADAAALWDYACATMAGVQARPVGGLFG